MAGDTDIQIYDTIPSVFALLRTLNNDAKLADFTFIARWPKLTAEEKRDFYSRFACHELNFFLHKKDRAFFDEVVRPFVEMKYAKTFLDAWLLTRISNPILSRGRLGN